MNKNRFKLIKEIGNGTSGKAILARDITKGPSSELVVLKEIPLNPEELEIKDPLLLREEVEILSKLSHPNIVKYFGSFEEGGFLYVVTEYANEGDMYQLLKKIKCSRPSTSDVLGEDQILKFSTQLISALAYLHEHKVLHRDIKSRNIFLSSPTDVPAKPAYANIVLKLGDFGISRTLTGTVELAHTAIGTPYYLSPEICESKPYDYKSDIWSLGCVIYEMCTLRHAFDSRHIRGLILKIIKAEFLPIPKYRRASLASFIIGTFQRSFHRSFLACFKRILQCDHRLRSFYYYQSYLDITSPPKRYLIAPKSFPQVIYCL